MFFLAWSNSYEAQKWKRSHRTESAGHRRPSPGWWHLPGIMPVSSTVIQVYQHLEQVSLALLHGWPGQTMGSRTLECWVQAILEAAFGEIWSWQAPSVPAIQPSLRKQWVLSLWPRKASLNRQPRTEAGWHRLFYFLFPNSHARKASFNPGDEHFLFSLFFLFPPTPQSSQWWRVKARVKGAGRANVSTKHSPPVGAGGRRGWISALCCRMTV